MVGGKDFRPGGHSAEGVPPEKAASCFSDDKQRGRRIAVLARKRYASAYFRMVTTSLTHREIASPDARMLLPENAPPLPNVASG